MNLKNTFFSKIILLAFLIIAPSIGFALSLDEAKAKGLVGETQLGYLAPVGNSNNSAVTNLINEINAKRRTEYTQISKKTGATLAAVEAMAGKKAIERTSAGHFVQANDGTMKRK